LAPILEDKEDISYNDLTIPIIYYFTLDRKLDADFIALIRKRFSQDPFYSLLMPMLVNDKNEDEAMEVLKRLYYIYNAYTFIELQSIRLMHYLTYQLPLKPEVLLLWLYRPDNLMKEAMRVDVILACLELDEIYTVDIVLGTLNTVANRFQECPYIFFTVGIDGSPA